MSQIFLSHSTRDAEVAARLAADLREVGLPVWKAPESILPGEEWVEAIQRGISTSTHFLLLMSPAAVESEWVQFEFNTALALNRRGRMVIIPLDYQPCDAPVFWTGFQAMPDYTENYHANNFKLLGRIKAENPSNPPDPTDPRTTINITIHGDASGDVIVAGHDVIYKDQPVAPPPAPVIPVDPREEAALPMAADQVQIAKTVQDRGGVASGTKSSFVIFGAFLGALSSPFIVIGILVQLNMQNMGSSTGLLILGGAAIVGMVIGRTMALRIHRMLYPR
jgi:hypothetical protein